MATLGTQDTGRRQSRNNGNKHDDKSWMRKGPKSIYDKWNKTKKIPITNTETTTLFSNPVIYIIMWNVTDKADKDRYYAYRMKCI
jgi:hypothetical protein